MTVVKTRYSRFYLSSDGMVNPCLTTRIIPKNRYLPSSVATNVIDFLYERKNCGFCLIFKPISPRFATPDRAYFRPLQWTFLRAWTLPMKLTVIPVTPFQQNCSIVVCETTNRAAIVDPGGDVERIIGGIGELGVTVEKVFLTHGHLDHCGGAKAVAQHYGVPIEGPHADDAFWIDQLPEQSRQFGFGQSDAFTPDRWLHDGDTVTIGDETLSVHHCPGHTPGHVVFFSEAHRLAWVGDVLFAGSIGRTDFPRGNHADLIRSVKATLWPLGDDVTFVPGHGPASTFGHERRTNPHVRDEVMA
jgi:hydroxyacylglutathione hydrolase